MSAQSSSVDSAAGRAKKPARDAQQNFPNDGKSLRLLCVDDDSAVLQLEKTLLETHGFEVVARTTGAEALDVLKSSPIDAVVTDLQMPDMDGVALATEARRIKPHIPILMFSGLATIPESARHLVDAYVVKGGPITALLGELDNMLTAAASAHADTVHSLMSLGSAIAGTALAGYGVRKLKGYLQEKRGARERREGAAGAGRSAGKGAQASCDPPRPLR